MGGKSVFANVMLCVIAGILAVGFYLGIDAMSVVKISQETLTDEVRALRADLAELQTFVSSGEFVAGSPASPGESPTEPARFANMDLRDPNAVDGDGLVTATNVVSPNMNSIVNNDGVVSGFWNLANDSCAVRNMAEPTRFEPQLALK